MASQDGRFSVASFFSAIAGGPSTSNPVHRLWKMKTPPTVLAFSWLTLRGRILTIDNLRRRDRILVNACPMELADKESVDHLFLGCKIAQVPWNKVLSQFDCSRILLHTILGLFKAWNLTSYSGKGKMMLKSPFLGVLWIIWKERNSRCFNGKALDVESLSDKLRFNVASWLAFRPQFHDTTIDMIVHN